MYDTDDKYNRFETRSKRQRSRRPIVNSWAECEAIIAIVDTMSDREVEANVAALTRFDFLDLLDFLVNAMTRSELIQVIDLVLDARIVR